MVTKAKKITKPIYVIAGKDRYLLEEQCEKLLAELLEPDQRTMSLAQFEPDSAEIIDVLDELRTLPFLTDKRVVLIKDADKFISANREKLEKYFEEPCSTGVLVLMTSSWAKNTRLAKKLIKTGQLIAVEEVKHYHLAGFVSKYAMEKLNKPLTPGSAELLIELTGPEPGRLCSELDKLAIYAQDEKTISAEHIEALIGHNRMFGAFAVIDAMAAGDIAGAMIKLRNMFGTDKNAPYTIVGAFAYHFRKMFNAKILQQKRIAQAQIVIQLGIWSNSQGFFRQLNAMSLERIALVLRGLAKTDYLIKTGQASAQTAIEQLVLKSV